LNTVEDLSLTVWV